jgi:hypothetical protein
MLARQRELDQRPSGPHSASRKDRSLLGSSSLTILKRATSSVRTDGRVGEVAALVRPAPPFPFAAQHLSPTFARSVACPNNLFTCQEKSSSPLYSLAWIVFARCDLDHTSRVIPGIFWRTSPSVLSVYLYLLAPLQFGATTISVCSELKLARPAHQIPALPFFKNITNSATLPISFASTGLHL